MEIVTTSDGSHTLFSPDFSEIYHSRYGAIQESKHVFIKNGLDYLLQNLNKSGRKSIRIFELGFGTGLNAILTYIEACSQNFEVEYETVELFPVPVAVVKELNYTQLIDAGKCQPVFHSMHLSLWDVQHQITTAFTFTKYKASILNFEKDLGKVDLIYFDAFAPQKQPELWTQAIISKMFDFLRPEGILVTYCSKGGFQRTLKQAGFIVEKLHGPPGKREMIRALKS